MEDEETTPVWIGEVPVRIGKSYRFEAAHQLFNHRGPCALLHGHSYRVEAEVEGIPKLGDSNASDYRMVLDFGDLDEMVEPLVKHLDHSFLNNELKHVFGKDRPTAEVLVLGFARVLSERVRRHTEGRVELSRVRVWETEKSYAEWRRDG